MDSQIISIEPLNLVHRKKETIEIVDCICKNKNHHSKECKTHRRKIYLNERKKEWVRKNGEFKCVCGNKVYHTKECKRALEKYKKNIRRKKSRDRLREEHRCIWCKAKVKPVITYPQYCEEHNPKNRRKESSEEYDTLIFSSK